MIVCSSVTEAGQAVPTWWWLKSVSPWWRPSPVLFRQRRYVSWVLLWLDDSHLAKVTRIWCLNVVNKWSLGETWKESKKFARTEVSLRFHFHMHDFQMVGAKLWIYVNHHCLQSRQWVTTLSVKHVNFCWLLYHYESSADDLEITWQMAIIGVQALRALSSQYRPVCRKNTNDHSPGMTFNGSQWRSCFAILGSLTTNPPF